MEEDNNYQQIEFNNNINFTSQSQDQNQNYFPTKENLTQNNYDNNILNGLNSNLDVLLSNLKQNTSSERMRYNTVNSKLKSPIKPNSKVIPKEKIIIFHHEDPQSRIIIIKKLIHFQKLIILYIPTPELKQVTIHF